MIVSKITSTVDGMKGLQKTVAGMLRNEVLVGIPDTTAQRQPTPDDPNPASNALIAYVQEFGSPDKNIPARPFLVPGVENARPEIVSNLQQAGMAALGGNMAAIDRGFNAAGIAAQNAVRAKITDGPFAPLADATVAARARRGRKGAIFEQKRRAAGEAASSEFAKPLIDTGQLRAAITYVVRPKGS